MPVFEGRPQVWYLAVCLECNGIDHGEKPAASITRVLPMPFVTESERDAWRDAHQDGTGHTVREFVEVREEGEQ